MKPRKFSYLSALGFYTSCLQVDFYTTILNYLERSELKPVVIWKGECMIMQC